MRRPPPLNPGARAWTPAEDAVLRVRYEREGAAAMAQALGRTLGSVHHRTRALGLYTHRRWTAKDDAQLEMLWGETSLAWLARKIGRTVFATYKRAQDIGLPLGLPDGDEYITTAISRTGYHGGPLRRILKWAGVDIRLAMSRPCGARRHFHIVDADEVNDAIARWLKTETLQGAARRHGIDRNTLAGWLEASGLPLPPKPDGKRHWRIPSDTIDAAVAARARLVSIKQAADAAGMPRCTLRSRAVAAGVPRPPGKLWLVPREVAQRLIERRAA